MGCSQVSPFAALRIITLDWRTMGVERTGAQTALPMRILEDSNRNGKQ